LGAEKIRAFSEMAETSGVTIEEVTQAINAAISPETLLVEDESGGCGAKFSLVCRVIWIVANFVSDRRS
jgi:hypothetical protein